MRSAYEWTRGFVSRVGKFVNCTSHEHYYYYYYYYYYIYITIDFPSSHTSLTMTQYHQPNMLIISYRILDIIGYQISNFLLINFDFQFDSF